MADKERKNKVNVLPAQLPEDVLVGRNAVTEALKSGRSINRLQIADGDLQGSAGSVDPEDCPE